MKIILRPYLLPLPDHPQLSLQASHTLVTTPSLEVICHSQYHSESVVAKTKNHFKQVLNVKDTIRIVSINTYVFTKCLHIFMNLGYMYQKDDFVEMWRSDIRRRQFCAKENNGRYIIGSDRAARYQGCLCKMFKPVSSSKMNV